MIDKLLKDCNLSLKQIDRLAVAIGPGSYTGLRIGITTMKMFASILNKEIVGISTLQALAANKQAADSLTLACLDARNNNFFAGAYVNGEAVIADGHYSFEALLEELKKVLAEKNIQKLIILGSGMEKHEDLLNSLPCDIIWGNEEENLVHASQIAKLALTSEVIDADQLVPRYLRRTQAEMDWHKKTGKPFNQIVIMLKKFRHFFKEEPEVNLNFTPYVTTLAGRTMQVMQASEVNIPDLLELEKKVYQGKQPWSSFSFASELRKKHNSLYLVIYDKAQLVGFIGGRFIPCEGHITNIAVDPTYQGQGIGHYLINLIVEIARKNGARQVSLEVRADNELAQKIYKGLGFEAQFIRAGYYQDDHMDAINMVLHLKGKEDTK
ncbi:ribosomal-protein-alanine acetyltransferase [Lactobacillus jensenii 269-3]|nr:ribosomal-protein-alanine acetyltransferase [Lactobacillus jensenii 269-3]